MIVTASVESFEEIANGWIARRVTDENYDVTPKKVGDEPGCPAVCQVSASEVSTTED